MKKNKIIILFILIIAYAGIYIYQRINNSNNFKNITGNNLKYDAYVTKIYDGDTIDIKFLNEIPKGCANTEIVRFIGINTPELNIHKPESAEYYAKEAYEFTKNELQNQYIQIQLDNISSERDKYGRLIAYIWVQEHCFNRILIEQGYAKYYSNFNFNSKNRELFSKAEEYARQNKLGMWK